ncbi:MAG: hypothetical protein IJH12_01470 [Clostridia bacterium]|nr:hypothetical protein [Clostridia bacterium]
MNEEYAKLFDNAFKCNISKKIRLDMTMLNKIYECFENDIYVPTNFQKTLSKQRAKKYVEVTNILDNKQRKAFDEYFEIENEIQIDIEKQLFIFGFLVAKELDVECKSIIKQNE